MAPVRRQVELPYVEIHAPRFRFPRSRLNHIGDLTGIVAVEGIDEREETLGGIRVVFASASVMDRYLQRLTKG